MITRISVGSPVLRLGLGLALVASVMAFDMSLNTNLAVYWGQNSYGSSNSKNTAEWQQSIEYYCEDDTIDTIPVAFLTKFDSTGGLPTIDLANTCSTTDDAVFSGTNLPNCSFLAAGIEKCQKAGKIVTLSIGGDSGSVSFSSDSQGKQYAQVIWDIFLGGSSNTRPFGSAVLDGIDMDIEGGSQTGYTSFLTALRKLMDGGDKTYYITAAPQCPYPDANIGTTLNEFGFDAVYVQFYNNYCSVSDYSNSNDWDFSTWDNWAKTKSPNANVKVYIGAAASSSAASSGYVSASTLASIITKTQSEYTSFGGVMLWDASEAYANGRYDKSAKAALTGSKSGSNAEGTFIVSGSSVSSTSTSASTTPTTPTSTPTPSYTPTSSPSPPLTSPTTAPTPTGPPAPTGTAPPPSPTSPSTGPCAGIDPWLPNHIYLEGDQVTYENQLWTADCWTEDRVPGGPAEVWTLDGSC